MKRRSAIIVLIATATVGSSLVTLFVACLGQRVGPTAANARRIYPDMSRADLETLLGPPTNFDERFDSDAPPSNLLTFASWESETGHIIVIFVNDRVIKHEAYFQPPLWRRLAGRVGIAL